MKNLGYTLVELLVVMSILSIIGIVSFINLGTFREDKLLDSNLNSLQSLIRTAQSNSNSSVNCDSSAGSTWSIEFTDNKTINLKCQASQSLPVLKSTVTLETGVTLLSITSSGGTCSSSFPTNPLTVKFLPLGTGVSFSDPTVSCIGTSNSITVTLSSKSGVRTVNINKGGSIN